MRNQEDQLQMRNLYEEGDCISAEVQNINMTNSVISLHTRSMKYGKLENGLLVQVPCHLVKRLPQHYVSIPVVTSSLPASGSASNPTNINHMDVIFGINGNIWITSKLETPFLL